ncbi:pyridoxal 5'-phosphate synthase glutaminase subunit PdxT [Subtercola boreus]|uniref:Pyridoxal 5'-phosphate synthase subunit PdxT n=1 Tax=Subtercola boreus TaxID=120213 RepID=A0A3E0WBD3_9MICO|nr:pyridoxal 5'-phosphate synthase glutaminase subunit PdxT [Subtercola boreus]RFA21329.1 pyridoxal 5'-phosphate synthase glutaminase subunit PdxT [Subtercola boreus]RFA21712.1 pyridoxal 5'-phosphate synthase glutaminase subunit PdxT [Subtercola boreus]RFA27681.1 pyridoxal 5'-phosphate synthase glutaminase subunit PdxT [Subtercola boreus]
MAGSTGASAPVGVLALQGDFREHAAVLRSFGADVISVRRPSELAQVSGLVIPGGESSVIDKLSRMFGVAEPLKEAIAAGLPVYGTCAGLIMLADRLVDAIAGQQSFGGLDIAVRRNAFGSQKDSFEVDIDIPELGEPAVHAVFIRAPVVDDVGERASVLGALEDGRVIAVEQGNLLGTSFHPEMTEDYRFHRRFYNRVLEVGFQR